MRDFNKLDGNLGAILSQEPGHFYMIEVEITAATTASDSATKSVGSLPFAWEELGAHFSETDGDWEVKITDDGEDKAFSADKIDVIALVGDNKQPYRLPHPWVFAGGSAINVEAKNNGSGTDTLKLLLIGKRLTSE